MLDFVFPFFFLIFFILDCFVYSCQLFLEAAEECCKIHNVQPTPVFMEKLIQTYEMMIVRHGYVILYLDKSNCAHMTKM